ncbi:unnamed protein product, partial [Ectocarpus fasciculatus]
AFTSISRDDGTRARTRYRGRRLPVWIPYEKFCSGPSRQITVFLRVLLTHVRHILRQCDGHSVTPRSRSDALLFNTFHFSSSHLSTCNARTTTLIPSTFIPPKTTSQIPRLPGQQRSSPAPK